MKNIIKIMLGLMGVLQLTACNDEYFDINDNPNQAVTSNPELILPSGLNQTARIDGLTLNQLGNLMGYYWAPASDYLYYVNEMNYVFQEGSYGSIFEDSYRGAMADYEYIIDYEGESPNQYENYKDISQIMEAFHFQYLVDLFGNVPYTQAFEGTNLLKPEYDEGQVIYDSIVFKIDMATANIKNNLNNGSVQKPGSEDIFFGGEMTRWVKFANTLKLRILMRQSELGNDDYLQNEINDMANDGYGFLGVGETALSNPGYSNSNGKQNPFYSNFIDVAGNQNGNYRATKGTDYLIDFLQDTNDPRLERLFAPAVNSGEYKGIAQGENTNPTNKNLDLSSLGPGLLKDPSQGVVVLSSFESLFLQAEAVQRGYLNGDAQEFYEAAVQESFEYLEVENAGGAASEYLDQPMDQVSWDSSSDKIETIIKQKWLALGSINGIELWMDYNRTGFPSDLPISLKAVRNQRPLRLLYPISESSTNIENKPETSTNTPFENKAFWDVN